MDWSRTIHGIRDLYAGGIPQARGCNERPGGHIRRSRAAEGLGEPRWALAVDAGGAQSLPMTEIWVAAPAPQHLLAPSANLG